MVKHKSKNKKFVPELRFPEFSGEWEEKSLGDVLFEHKTKNLNNSFNEVFSVAKEKGVVNQIEHLGRSFAAKDLSNYKVVYPEDVVYTKSPTSNFPYGIIKQNQLNRAGVVSTLYAVFRPQNKYIGTILHYYFLSWIRTYNYLNPLIQKGAKNTINISNEDFLNGAKISLPHTKKEQKRIVDFLVTMDEWIENLKKQKEELEQYKKGLMQKIFSQEVCFKDDNGKNFPDWKEKKLGNFLTLSSARNKNNKIKLILSVNNKKGFINQSEQFEDHRVASRDTSNYRLVETGDFAYNPSRINVGSIACLRNFNKGLVSPMYIVFKLSKNLNTVFFENFIQTHYFKFFVRNSCSGSVRDSLSFEDLCNFKVKFPVLKEQERIADFLSSVDKLTESKQKQIIQAETWEKGLMQGLFV